MTKNTASGYVLDGQNHQLTTFFAAVAIVSHLNIGNDILIFNISHITIETFKNVIFINWF